MIQVSIQITRFVDPGQPGFVECVLIDAHGKSHAFIEKVPVVTHLDLWSDSTYPVADFIACEIEAELVDSSGRALARINTERPWGMESSTGETHFVVLASQLVDE
jgi:hypothetical protein